MRNFFSLALSMRVPLRKYAGGFTLVELIVVITILATLSAIWLLSFSGYSSGARDSTRVEDLTNMQKSLAISATTSVNGKYPTPDNGVQILNGGVLMNTQGYAGKTTLSSIKFNGAGLDPLDSTYYTYSVNKTQTGFALMAYLENASNLTLTSYIEKSLAATTDYSTRYPMVSGNPIGVLIASGSLQPIQATASAPIELTTSTAPYTAYIAPRNTVTWSGASFASAVATSVAVATTGTASTTTGSSLVSGVCTGLPANAIYYGNSTTYSLVNASMGTSLTGAYVATGTILPNTCQFNCAGGYTWNGVNGCVAVPVYSSSTTYTAGQVFSYSGTTVTVSSNGVGVSSNTKALSVCDTNDIVVWSGTNIQIWSACNMGATNAWTGGLTITNCSNSATDCDASLRYTLGDYYEWGRNDPVTSGTYTAWVTGGVSAGMFNSSTLSTGNNLYYASHNASGDWYGPDDAITSTDRWVANTQWPCPTGYYVPTGGTTDTTTDWGKTYTIVGGSYASLVNNLKLPLVGARYWNTGNYSNQSVAGGYWSSTITGNYAFDLWLSGSSITTNDTGTRGYGFAIRCLRH